LTIPAGECATTRGGAHMTPNPEFSLSLDLLLYIFTLPVAWVPPVQAAMFGFLWESSSPMIATVKLILFLLPAGHLFVAMWASTLAVYTIPFRSARRQFIVAMLTTWWDTGRTVALYWAGIAGALFLTAGWIWGFIRILAGGLYLAFVELIMLPFTIVKRASQSTLQPGIPWIAVILTLVWSLLEAGIFSYTLYPTVSDVAADLVGARAHFMLQPALFFVVFLLIAGSFACLQVMVEAIHQRNWKDMAQMIVVELFVMFVEVVFLYRELVDAITPALAQQSGGQLRMGVAMVLTISAVAWIGIRGMTWFLFGRFGTPTLLAIISGRGIVKARGSMRPAEEERAEQIFGWTKEMISHVKAEIGWFHTTGKELLEAYVLPPLQLVAATMNFFMVFFTGRHLFRLPLKSLHTFMETGELIKLARAQEGSTSGGAGSL
ncbi:MAG: hypothetical protein ACE5JN_11340, partial [Candidatus Methylomirabilia bacterium]